MAESVGAGQVRRQGDRRDASLPAAAQRVVHRGMVIAEDDDPLTLLATARNAPGQCRRLRLRDKGTVQGQTAIAEAIRHGGKIPRQLRKEERVIAAEKDLNLPGKAVLLRQDPLQSRLARRLQHFARGLRRYAAALVQHPVNGGHADANLSGQHRQ